MDNFDRFLEFLGRRIEEGRSEWWKKRSMPLVMGDWVVIGTDCCGNTALGKGNVIIVINLN